ncbi:mechanosensitive ion channel family protein [Nanoarchaeota archaeon]
MIDLMFDLSTLTEFMQTTPGIIISVVIIAALTIVIANFVSYVFDRSSSKSRLRRADPTKYVITKHVLSAMIYLSGLAFIVRVVPSLKALSVSIFAGAGVLAIIIGFASQQAVSNIIGGMFIAMFEPFRVGDWIKVKNDGTFGVVEDITLRHTVIKNFENKRIIIPNSVISNDVIENYHIGEKKLCKFIEFNVSYDSNMDKAMKIMKEEAKKHPDFYDNRTKEEKEKGDIPAIKTKVLGFGDSSIKIRAWVWAKDPSAAYRLGWDLNKKIKERFDSEGIEIPFPHRTIVYKTDIQKNKNKIKKRTKR